MNGAYAKLNERMKKREGKKMFQIFKKSQPKNEQIDTSLYAVTEGNLKNVSEVDDEVFSAKIMGNGYSIVPADSEQQCDVYSPVVGVVTTVFPTKHAVGIRMENDLDILVHFGIDTVEMEGKPFEMFVKIDDEVTPQTKLASIDLNQLREAGKLTDLIVVCTSAKQVESMTLASNEKVIVHEVVGNVIAKA